MNTSVTYSLTFSALHSVVVDGVMPDYPSCFGRPHGHRWRVSITVGRGVDPRTGAIAVNQTAFEDIVAEFDGENLNEMLKSILPTPENLAAYLGERLRILISGLASVTVEMGDDVSATVSYS